MVASSAQAPAAPARRARWRLHAQLKPRTRKIVAAALLIAVVLVEYALSTLPVAIDVTGRASVASGHELVLSDLRTGGPVLAYSGKAGDAADIRFERARLSPETIGLLRMVGVEVSDAEGPVGWITGSESAARTVFEVSAIGPAQTPSELRLRALPPLGASQAQLELEARGAPLQALIAAPFAPDDRSARSEKILSLGGRSFRLSGAVPLKLIVAEGSSVRARFSQQAGSQATDFILGSIPVRAADTYGIRAHAIGTRKSGTTDRYDYFACAAPPGAIAWSTSAALSRGECPNSEAFVTSSEVRVSDDRIEADVAGTAWAQRGGEALGSDPLTRIADNPVLAGALIAANLALAAWLVFELVGRRLGVTANWSGGVFISYRREDSAPQAGRVYDHLSAHFGTDRVFMDVDTIRAGEDFARNIDESLGVTDALLAIIGKRWLDSPDAAGARRLDDPGDFVRTEIATALERGTWVIPVLVGGAAMPRAADLPNALAPLARHNAIDVSDARFSQDIRTLIGALEQGPAESHTGHGRIEAEAAT